VLDVLSPLPADLWKLRWDAAAVPTLPAPDLRSPVANCQAFAYAVLAAHGFRVAPLRSDELWVDDTWTARAGSPSPLDLVLFNATEDPFGAHVGVVVDASRVLHLNKEVGAPVVWEWADFACRSRYRVVIGYKTPLRKT
jgi:hypothetical protein